ncbi:hypothetical protein, partial [Pseudomonas aeruginosa]|uniref:hypothetical protein n=1 Tax=Pseudomonas aeruginosa TaxID=287 RepID=UPI001CD25AA5
HRPVQGRHHLPHHPLPMLYRITRHTALTSAHRPRLIESTHTTTILTRREIQNRRFAGFEVGLSDFKPATRI